MLSQKDLSLLYQIISDDNQTFKKISESFQNNFSIEKYSEVGTTLVFLLRDNLLNIQKRRKNRIKSISSYYFRNDKIVKIKTNKIFWLIFYIIK